MRRISLMYEKSGGCKPFSLCRDCCCFSTKEATEETEKRTECSYYNEHCEEFPFWNGNWSACRFFGEKGSGKRKVKPKCSTTKQSTSVREKKPEKVKTPKKSKTPKTMDSDKYVQLLLF